MSHVCLDWSRFVIHVDQVAIALLLFGVWLEWVRRAQEGSESSKELFEGQWCACVVLCEATREHR